MGGSVRRAAGFKELRVELPLELWQRMGRWTPDQGDQCRMVRRLIRYYVDYLERRLREDEAALYQDMGGTERLAAEEAGEKWEQGS